MDQRKSMGKLARDKVTGFEGVIVGVCAYLTGCDQYGIQPPAKDGEIKPSQWFDVHRVEIVGEGVRVADVSSTRAPGGPARDAPRGAAR